jgi:predicted dehydrogenase
VVPEPVRVALVGVGRWGEKHLRLLGERHDRASGLELVAAVDTNPSARARAAALRPGLRVGDGIDTVLVAEVDALIIATPPETHSELARHALLAGKHVLVEKPLSICPVAARELSTLAKLGGLALRTGHLVLHHPAYERLFDELQHVPASALRCVREGADRGAIDPVEVLWSLGPHDVAVALRVLGLSLHVTGASALERGVRIDLVSETGGRAEVRLERLTAPSRRGSSIETTQASYELDEFAGTLQMRSAGAPGERRQLALEASGPPLDRQLDAFLRLVRGQPGPEPQGDLGPAVVALLDEATRRLRAHHTVNARPATGNEDALPMAAAGMSG